MKVRYPWILVGQEKILQCIGVFGNTRVEV